MKLKLTRNLTFGLSVFLAILVAKAENVQQPVVPPVVELTHWWKSPGELAALKEIQLAVEARGAQFVTTSFANYDALRKRIGERLLMKSPPAMAQWMAGQDTKELIELDAVKPAPEYWRGQKLRDLLFPEVLHEVLQNGKIIGIPVGIHVQNMAFYNAAIYQKLGLQPPLSWNEFFEQALIIQKAGYIPLALSDDPSQIGRVFNTMLLEQLGVEGFKQFYRKDAPVAQFKAGVLRAVTLFFKLKPFLDPAYKGRLWSDSTKLLVEGKAAMQIMGDFAKGEMIYAGLQPGKDFWCSLAPGAHNLMLYSIDTFAMLNTNDPMLNNGQKLLFDVLLDPNTQAAFSSKKGSTPVRYGVDVSKLDSCAQKIYHQLLHPDPQHRSATGSYDRWRFFVVYNIMRQSWAEKRSVEETTAALINSLDELRD